MTGPELGFLLLGSSLGNPDRKILTVPQMRNLALCIRTAPRGEEDRQMSAQDLKALGYGEDAAQRILGLLGQEELAEHYLSRAAVNGCVLLTRVSEHYPRAIRRALGLESPGCIWAKGNLELLKTPMVSLVGSRELHPKNRRFAREVGIQAARQGYTLVSGNARGADRTAQDAALLAGGCVISIVADDLEHKYPGDKMLYLSENSFDLPFSAQRALSRNRLIHSLGCKTFVAQCTLGSGGTWDGTVKNLSRHCSPVFCFDDGSEAAGQLRQMGAVGIGMEELADFSQLEPVQTSFFENIF